MSCDSFDTKWYELRNFANELQRKINNNTVPDKYGDAYNISEDCLSLIRTAQKVIKSAAGLAHIIDLRYSEDSGNGECMEMIGEILGGVKSE